MSAVDKQKGHICGDVHVGFDGFMKPARVCLTSVWISHSHTDWGSIELIEPAWLRPVRIVKLLTEVIKNSVIHTHCVTMQKNCKAMISSYNFP